MNHLYVYAFPAGIRDFTVFYKPATLLRIPPSPGCFDLFPRCVVREPEAHGHKIVVSNNALLRKSWQVNETASDIVEVSVGPVHVLPDQDLAGFGAVGGADDAVFGHHLDHPGRAVVAHA